jgi:hypothetical protein
MVVAAILDRAIRAAARPAERLGPVQVQALRASAKRALELRPQVRGLGGERVAPADAAEAGRGPLSGDELGVPLVVGLVHQRPAVLVEPRPVRAADGLVLEPVRALARRVLVLLFSVRRNRGASFDVRSMRRSCSASSAGDRTRRRPPSCTRSTAALGPAAGPCHRPHPLGRSIIMQAGSASAWEAYPCLDALY